MGTEIGNILGLAQNQHGDLDSDIIEGSVTIQGFKLFYMVRKKMK